MSRKLNLMIRFGSRAVNFCFPLFIKDCDFFEPLLFVASRYFLWRIETHNNLHISPWHRHSGEIPGWK